MRSFYSTLGDGHRYLAESEAPRVVLVPTPEAPRGSVGLLAVVGLAGVLPPEAALPLELPLEDPEDEFMLEVAPDELLSEGILEEVELHAASASAQVKGSIHLII